MENFLKDLVTYTKSLVRKKETVDFDVLINYFHTTKISARSAQTMINDNVSVFNYLHESLISDISLNASKTDRDLKKKYNDLLSSTGWARSIKRPQTMGKFHVFEKAFGSAHKDIDWIIDNFTTYFPDTDKEVDFSDLTVAQAYILSYVSNVQTTISWFQYLVHNYNLPNRSHTFPYQLQYMDKNKDIVEKTLMDGLEATNRRTSPFQTSLQKIIKDGKNMRIMIDDNQTIDTFASKRDFSSDVQEQMRGFFNVPMFIGNTVLSLQRKTDEHRQTTIEWMNTRIAVISMDMQELNPDSDEYRRKEKILNNYADDVADFERKLNKGNEDLMV